MNTHVVFLDNLDSFTYNLVDEFQVLDCPVSVFRNEMPVDKIVDYIEKKQKEGPVILALSPGPGNPEQAGCLLALLDKMVGKVPVFGICLGHQAIIQHYGGEIIKHQLLHGQSSQFNTLSHPIFQHLQQPITVARYHSLIGQGLNNLEELATFESIPMAVINEKDKVIGLQFHPESILTAQGSLLIKNIIGYLVR